jgi:hypothetical protein
MRTYKTVEIQQLNGDIDRGGWQIRGTIFNDGDAIGENEKVQVFVRLKADGAWDFNFYRRFVGYALPQNIRRYHDRSETTFIANTSDAYLKRGRVQGIYFTEQAAPANEHQMTNLTSGKIVDHIIDDHTNMGPSTPAPNGWLDISDIDQTNSADLTVLALHEGIIWERIRQLAENEFYICYCDKEDHFHYIPHPAFDAVLPAVTMVWDDDFFTEPLEIIPRTDARVNQVILKALTDSGTILTSSYPTNPAVTEPEAYGEKLELTRLRCNTQAQLDLWAKRRYQWENRDYTVRVNRAGLAGVMFELMDRIPITYSSTEDGISWSQKDFFIHKIAVNYNQKERIGNSTFVLEEAADTSL